MRKNRANYPSLFYATVMKCKSTGSLVATFLGTDNLRHPYNSIVYCGSSFPYSIQTVNDISTRSYISIYTDGYPRIKAYAIQETSLDNYLIIRLPNITIVAMLL